MEKTYFRCDAMRCTMSTESCADSWRASQSHEPRRWSCRGCPIGARHAGQEVRPLAERKYIPCPRCGREAARLIRGTVCVSCRNREIEIAQGRYRRGRPYRRESGFFKVGGAGISTAILHHVALLLVDSHGPEMLKVRAGTEHEAAVVAMTRRPDAIMVEPIVLPAEPQPRFWPAVPAA